MHGNGSERVTVRRHVYKGSKQAGVRCRKNNAMDLAALLSSSSSSHYIPCMRVHVEHRGSAFVVLLSFLELSLRRLNRSMDVHCFLLAGPASS